MTDLPLVIFDVNETLLDLDSLTPHFESILGDRAAMREWFAQLILYSEALSLAGDYVPFGELGGTVLKMVAPVRGRDVGEADLMQVKQAVASMPPHKEVHAALSKLRDAGFRLFTLTNNPKATCVEQLERAGILHNEDRLRRSRWTNEAV
jgi:2-haloacid dehalogenase